MKSIIRNKRSPRKYTPLESVILTDDAGMVWATVSIDDGRISISHLAGVSVHSNEHNGMGDYLIGQDVSYKYSWCPTCKFSVKKPHVYDPRTNKVTCKECGYTWGTPM